MLPRGYGTRKEDNKKLYAGERDRVLSEAEEGAIRKVLVKKEEHLLFDMALETAMRLSEMFVLTWDQVDSPSVIRTSVRRAAGQRTPMRRHARSR